MPNRIADAIIGRAAGLLFAATWIALKSAEDRPLASALDRRLA